VSGHEWESHPARVRQATVKHLEVRSAHARDVAANHQLPRPGGRRLELHPVGVVRALEENRLHRPTVPLLRQCPRQHPIAEARGEPLDPGAQVRIAADEVARLGP
jgi:hypothetical protein